MSFPKGIYYDKRYQMFHLYCGNSLYALNVGPERFLEHAYWGPAVRMGFDLRYARQNIRVMQFETSQIPEKIILDNIIDSTINSKLSGTIQSEKSPLDLCTSANFRLSSKVVFLRFFPTYAPTLAYDILKILKNDKSMLRLNNLGRNL